MEACKMCWKTKEISPVFAAYPKAVEFCKGCAFDIHRVVNALAYALDTSGYAIALVRRSLKILDVAKPGSTFINLLTGEFVEELRTGPPPDSLARETVRVFQEVDQGKIEGGSPEGGLRKGGDLPDPPETPLPMSSSPVDRENDSKPRKSK